MESLASEPHDTPPPNGAYVRSLLYNYERNFDSQHEQDKFAARSSRNHLLDLCMQQNVSLPDLIEVAKAKVTTEVKLVLDKYAQQSWFPILSEELETLKIQATDNPVDHINKPPSPVDVPQKLGAIATYSVRYKRTEDLLNNPQASSLWEKTVHLCAQFGGTDLVQAWLKQNNPGAGNIVTHQDFYWWQAFDEAVNKLLEGQDVPLPPKEET